MARPSSAQDAGNGSPARPPPVTHSWIKTFIDRPFARVSNIRVIPVLDLRCGRAVHARGGRRDLYRPVAGVLGRGDDPFSLSLAFRDVLGLVEFYLADLDAIAGGPPDFGFLRRATGEGLRVWVDAGARGAADLDALAASGADTVIAATETFPGPAPLREFRQRARPGSVVFGLDLKDGRPIVAHGSTWRADHPRGLIDEALSLGIRRILILDSARIGSGGGVGTVPLAAALIREAPDTEVTVGGGVSGKDDLMRLADLGVSAVLVGSALHDGRIGVRELREVCRPSPGRLLDR
ncbi:MAG: hisA/hisF family protein [Planctomycetia bacterium]|nr:hisA/hisF family protein [Planctomycetia bacterium]